MLPASKPAKHLRALALPVALVFSLTVPAPALALDRHEQGIVAGALGLLFIQGVIQAANAQQPQAAPAPAPTPVYQPQRVSAHSTPAAYAFGSYSSGERRAIQRSLARGGYYYGAIDGAFGRGTYNATAAFARDTGAASALGTQAGAYGVYDRLLYGAQ